MRAVGDRYYRRSDSAMLEVGSRKAFFWRNEGAGVDEVHFRCPCGHRTVSVHSPPHELIAFDADGKLTIKPSIGSREGWYWKSLDPECREREHWPGNACHFYIRGGVPEMCGDATCPGRGVTG